MTPAQTKYLAAVVRATREMGERECLVDIDGMVIRVSVTRSGYRIRHIRPALPQHTAAHLSLHLARCRN